MSKTPSKIKIKIPGMVLSQLFARFKMFIFGYGFFISKTYDVQDVQKLSL